jgi:predicted O-methyltransferase YrrM
VLCVLVKNDIGLLRLRAGQVFGTSNFLKLSEKEMAKALDEITPAKQESSWRMLNRWHSFLYAIVRAYSPSLVVETGVLYGHSSAAILAALDDNGVGRLTSIDLPREEHQNIIVGRQHVQVGLSSDELSLGCAVPVELRSRWNLVLGNSLELLPKILGETGDVSIFIHDSLHTYDHMMAEFSLGFDALEPGGLLISDDIGYNVAWHDFCESKKEDWKALSKGSESGDKFAFLIKSYH